ncbi:hypothetical protein O9993_17285 [Vibrio lentus]|nr:hypothetical protein [Vibrio lentus]
MFAATEVNFCYSKNGTKPQQMTKLIQEFNASQDTVCVVPTNIFE